jgi:hypothetical protein
MAALSLGAVSSIPTTSSSSGPEDVDEAPQALRVRPGELPQLRPAADGAEGRHGADPGLLRRLRVVVNVDLRVGKGRGGEEKGGVEGQRATDRALSDHHHYHHQRQQGCVVWRPWTL